MRKKLEETPQGQGMSEFRWNLEKVIFCLYLIKGVFIYTKEKSGKE